MYRFALRITGRTADHRQVSKSWIRRDLRQVERAEPSSSVTATGEQRQADCRAGVDRWSATTIGLMVRALWPAPFGTQLATSEFVHGASGYGDQQSYSRHSIENVAVRKCALEPTNSV